MSEEKKREKKIKLISIYLAENYTNGRCLGGEDDPEVIKEYAESAEFLKESEDLFNRLEAIQ